MTTLTLHLSHPNYRPDIDGLRAVAVLSVVAFHAFPTLMKGGFVGVDVFFVISGFLISTTVFENLDRDSFSFREFYSRRITRIFPSLIVVLIACFTLGWFALLANEYKQLGKHIAAGAVFFSNFILWNEAGYFDNSAETKPLLHLWSLAIEEQFYIVWPLFLWLAWKGKFNLLTITILVAITSFILNIKGVKQDSIATFYSPQTRFWELLSGSLLAWLTLYKRENFANTKFKLDSWLSNIIYREKQEVNGKTLANIISLTGSLLLVYSFLRIHKDLSFPGIWALIPVSGTVLIILAGSKAWINHTFLSNKVAIWFGLISFPLYLWHWPLLSFARIVESENPSRNIRIAVVIFSILLAWLTYKLVECPFRFGKHGKFKVIALLFIMSIIGFVGYNTYERNGLSFRLKDREAFDKYFDNSSPDWNFATKQGIFKDYRIDCDFFNLEAHRYGKTTNKPLPGINSSCYVLDKSKEHRVLIWGDSHAQTLYYGLNKNLPTDWQILQVASSGCNPAVVTIDSDINYCDRSNFVAIETIKKSKPDVVVVAQNIGHNVNAALNIRNILMNFGVSKVIFLGPLPHWTSDLPKIISRQLWIATPERTFVGVDKNIIHANRILKADFLSFNLNYLDAISVFCDSNGCLTRIGENKLTGITTNDYGHLLQISSDYLARELLVKSVLSLETSK
jgi:peptidoglycan/LPS O-acetylase OafA/YrhL